MASAVVALEFSLAFRRGGELTYVHLFDAIDLEQKVVFRIEVNRRDRRCGGDEDECLPATHSAFAITQQGGDWI
jgi:hypothetical protein